MFSLRTGQAVDNDDDDDDDAMRLLLVVVSLVAGSAALAHPGHGATPAHVHVGDVPVDLGAWALLALLGGVVIVAEVWARRRR